MKTKHIKIHHHFIKKKVLDQKIILSYISINIQLRNVLTKNLVRINFEIHQDALDNQNLSNLAQDQYNTQLGKFIPNKYWYHHNISSLEYKIFYITIMKISNFQ